MVTVPLEADLLSNVPFVDILSSKSVPGLSSIELVFEPGTELLKARQVVQERLAEAMVALPGASKPPQMLQPRSSTTRAMMIGLSSKDLSLIDMSVLARWNIRPRLMGIPGVANVAIWGQREQQLQVLADPDRMQANERPADQCHRDDCQRALVVALELRRGVRPGHRRLYRHAQPAYWHPPYLPHQDPADLGKMTLEGRPDLRLSDVATVVEDHQPLIGDALLKSGPGLILVVEKWPNASTLDVTKRVETALAAMAPGLKGVADRLAALSARQLHRVGDRQSDHHHGRRGSPHSPGADVGSVRLARGPHRRHHHSGLDHRRHSRSPLRRRVDEPHGRRRSRRGAWCWSSTTRLFFGSNLKRRLAAPRPPEQSTAQLITAALSETHGPLAFAVLIILLGLVPLFFLKGLSGAFFPPVAIAYGIAVVVSAIVAIVLAPALALLLYPCRCARLKQPGGLHRPSLARCPRAIGVPFPACSGHRPWHSSPPPCSC